MTSIKSKITTPRSEEKKTTDENGGTKLTSHTVVAEEAGSRFLQNPMVRKNDTSVIDDLDVSKQSPVQEQISSAELESDRQIRMLSPHKPSLFKK